MFVWHGGHLILSVSLIESIFVLHALLLTQYITGKFQIKIFLPNGCDVITDSQSEQIFLDFLNKFSISLIVSQIFKSIFLLSCSVSVKETQIWLDWCGWNNYSDRPKSPWPTLGRADRTGPQDGAIKNKSGLFSCPAIVVSCCYLLLVVVSCPKMLNRHPEDILSNFCLL